MATHTVETVIEELRESCDDCPYYLRGWEWMERQYGVKSSYRYRFDPRGIEESERAALRAAARDWLARHGRRLVRSRRGRGLET